MSRIEELMAEVDQLSAKDCKASSIWKPDKVGDSLFGKLAKMENISGPYGPQLKLMIRTATGEEVTRYCSKGELKQLRKRGTKVGDDILLKCKAIERMHNGKEGHIIGVASRPPGNSNGAAADADSQENVFDADGDDEVL